MIAIPIPVVLISIPVFSKSMISIQIPVASDSYSGSCVPKSFDFNFDSDSHSIMWLQSSFFSKSHDSNSSDIELDSNANSTVSYNVFLIMV